MVVKPLALSGSRGVMRVDDETELVGALSTDPALLLARADIQAERHEAHELVLVEQFIEGREFAIEALMNHGTLDVLAIFDKPDPLDGPFFEETIYVTPSTAPPETQAAIVDAIARGGSGLRAVSRPGPRGMPRQCQGVFVLEVAARPIGGLCARALRFVARESAPQRHGRPFPARPDRARRSKNSCCVTRSARSSTRGSGKRRRPAS